MGFEVSIVIPTFNGRRLLRECLAAVDGAAREFGTKRVEIVVVDDSSNDGTAEWLRSALPSVKVVVTGRNLGFTGAANAGLEKSSGEWIALLNNDTKVDRRWITAAAECFADVRNGAVASQVIDADTGLVESAGDGYSTAGLAFQGGNGGAPLTFGPPRRVFSACAAAAFYRRSALEAAGVFEERFGAYYEDVDLGYRLNLAGWRTVLAPASLCFHLRGRSYRGRSWRMLSNSSRNSEAVFFSCTPGRLLLKMLPAHAAAVLGQAAWRLWHGEFLPFAAGKAAFLFDLPWIARRRGELRELARTGPGELEGLFSGGWMSVHMPARKQPPGRPLRRFPSARYRAS